MPEQVTHPSREELNAYSLGELTEDKAVAIDSHISECRPCCETIAELSSDDTFVGLLKEARQLPTDQTVEQNGSQVKPSSLDVPTALAEHPRYEIVGLIGKGGMGDVYKATHRMMDRTVALKIIKRELMQNSQAVDRFHREVKAAAKLSHPNIVTSHDAEQVDDVHFMVMEYVDGFDLSHIIKDRGALPVAEACDYVRQAAIGLQHAHEQGMVHRDIKPHNLMVTDVEARPTVKILDFGLASLAPVTSPDADTVEAHGDLTAAGAIMGTPDFIAPEQADDARQADIRSDIYGLGTTLYFLLSGRPPFVEGSVTDKLKSHAEVEPEPLESLRDDIPADLAAIVSKMIAKDPANRFQTPEEAVAALESFARARQKETPEQSSGHQLQPSRQQSHTMKLTAVAALFVAAIVAAIVYYIVTNEGIVRIKVLDESLSVAIDGRTVTIKDGEATPLTVRAGDHELVVRQGETELITDEFEVRRNDEIRLRVEIGEGEVVLSNGEASKKARLPGARTAADQPSLRIANDGTWTTHLGTESRSWDLRGNRLGKVVVRLLHISSGKMKTASEHSFGFDGVSGETAGRVTLVAEGRRDDQLSLSLNVTFDDVSADEARTHSSPLIIPKGLLRSGATINVDWDGQRLFPGEAKFVHTMVLLPDGSDWRAITHRKDDTDSMIAASKQGAEFVAVTLDWDYPHPESADEKRTDHERIQGTWRVISVEESDGIVPQEKPVHLTFANGQLTYESSGFKKERTYRLDPSTKPMSIDITEENGRQLGIYDLQGDTLQLCYPDSEDTRDRPNVFQPTAGEASYVVIKLKRVKRDKSTDSAEKIFATALVNGCKITGTFTKEQAEVTVHNPTGEPQDVAFHCQIIYQNSCNRSDIFQLKAGEFTETVAPGRPVVKRFDRVVDPNASLPADYLKDLLVLRVSGKRLDTTRDYPIAPDKKLDLTKQPVTIALWPSGVSPAAVKKSAGPFGKLFPKGRPAVPQPNGNPTSNADNTIPLKPKEDRVIDPAAKPSVVFGAAPFRFGGRINSLEYSSDGKQLLSAGGQWGAALWDAQTGKLIQHFATNEWRAWTTADFSPDGGLIAIAGAHEAPAPIWDAETGKLVRSITKGGRAVRFAPDGKSVFTESSYKLSRFDVATGKNMPNFAGFREGNWMFATPRKGLLVAGTAADKLHVWDWKSGEEVATASDVAGGHHNAKDIVFTPDGESLVAFGKRHSRTVELREARTLKVTRTFKLNGSPRCLNISGDGRTLAVGVEYGWLHVLDLSSGDEVNKWKVPHSEIDNLSAVALTPDGTRVATGLGHSPTVQIWDVETGKPLFPPGPQTPMTLDEVLRTESGQSADDGASRAEVAEKLSKLAESKRNGVSVEATALSDDGRYGVLALRDERILVYDLENSKYLRTIPKTQSYVSSLPYHVALSPDGRLLAAGRDKKIKLWNVLTGKKVSAPDAEDSVNGFAFSRDGDTLAVISQRKVLLWSVKQEQVRRVIVDQEHGVRSIAFSPDGKILATGSNSFADVAVLWEIASGRRIRELSGARGGVTSLAFSHDGSKLYAETESSLVVGWDLEMTSSTGSNGKSAAAPEGPRFQLHFVEPRQIEGVTGHGIKFGTGAKDPLVYMHIKPALVLQPRHVASIKMSSYEFAGTPSYSIDIELTDAARKKLAAVVKGKGDHMRHVTYVVDGKRRGGWQRYEINVAKPGGIPEICRADSFCPMFTASGKDEEEYVQQIVNALNPEESTSAPAPSEKATKTPMEEK